MKTGARLVAAMVLAVVVVAVLWKPWGPRVTPYRTVSASNLKNLYFGLMSLDRKNEALLPENLGILIEEECALPDHFFFPDRDIAPPENVTHDLRLLAQWAVEHSDYVYVAGGKELMKLNKDDVIAYEKPGHWPEDSIHILFGDGTVKFVPLAEARPILNAHGIKMQ